MREVIEAVKRENIAVTTVFAMHQEPVPWAQVTASVENALKRGIFGSRQGRGKLSK